MKAPNFLEPKQRKTFRDKYLAVILAVAALLFCSTLSAQTDSTKYSQINGYGFKYKRWVGDSIIMIPLSTSPHTPYRPGGIRYKASDSTIQVWTGNQWNSIVTGVGNGVDTAYMVNDTVLVIETPDETFMLQVGKRHVDTLYRKAGQDSIFYQIAGVERAILDSVGAPIDTGFIRNQFSSAQDASFYIDSAGRMKYLNIDSFATFAPISTPAHAEGRMFYDNDNKTISLMDDISGTVVQLSQEQIVRARNNTGSTINDGEVVYISGAVGQSLTIALAQANSATTSQIIGLATHDIGNNTVGKVTTFGLVNDINTSSFNDGDRLYLSQSTPGEITNVAPTSGISMFIGYCLTSHVTQGKIFVSAQDVLPGATQLTDSSFVVGVDTITIIANKPAPSWQQTLNVSRQSTTGLIFDTTMVGNPVVKEWMRYEPLVKSETATNAFRQWQFSGSNNGSFNEVMLWGWNMGNGGGQHVAGKPAIGESWESNYQINPDGVSDRLMEKHEIYVTPGGTQHRLSSYTINTNTGTIGYYHTVGSFSLYNVGTHTPYFSVLGTSNNTQQTFINSSNQSNYFSTNVNFNQDASTAAFTLSAGASGRPVNLYNLSGFTQAALPNSVFSRNGYDGTQIQFNGATTGALARWVSDSSQTMISTFTNVAMRFMPNTAQALDLRSTRVNIYQPTGVGTGVTTPIAQLDVRNSALNQTIYCENTKAAGKAGIFTTVNAGGSNTGLSVNASGGTDNKGINFEASMGAGDWNIYSSNASKTYLAGKVQLGTTSDQARKLYINGSIGANKDSITTISAVTTHFVLVQDTAAGAEQGRIKKITTGNLRVGLNGTTTHGFGSIANNSSATTTISVTGAVDGDYVLVTKPVSSGWSNGESYTAWVSGPDTVTVRQNNNSGGSVDFGSQTINVKVIKQ